MLPTPIIWFPRKILIILKVVFLNFSHSWQRLPKKKKYNPIQQRQKHIYLRTKKIVYTPFVIHLWVINRELPLQLDLVWGHEEEKNKEYFHASTLYWTIHHHTTWWDDWRFCVLTNRIWYRSMNIKCYKKLHGNRTHETSCYRVRVKEKS